MSFVYNTFQIWLIVTILWINMYVNVTVYGYYTQIRQHLPITSNIKSLHLFNRIESSNNDAFKNRLHSQNQKLYLFPTSTYPYFKEAVYINGFGALLLLLLKQSSLTLLGLWHATILGVGLWTFLDFNGWFVCVSYLILGSLVTTIKMKEKEKLGIAEKRGGKRSSENVWGSAATAMVCAMLTYIYPQQSKIFRTGYVASIATKLSDTFGSEIGKAYGKSTYLITTLRSVPKGTEGAVSIEGTIAGVIGSILITMIAYSLGVITSWNSVLSSIIAAFIATTIESYIGAVFQDKITWLNNELVNLIMTVIGAIIAIGLRMRLQ